MAADLLADTAVTLLAGFPNRYGADLPDSWNWHLPAGGMLMTVGLRAIREALGDASFVPVSATATFCQPVPEGPVVIDVDVLRRGNAATQVRAAVRSVRWEDVGLEVSATFARERTGPGIDFLDAAPPDVPLPNDAPVLDERQQMGGKARNYPFLDNIDTRLALGNLWWERDWPAGKARWARWVRYKVPQRMESGMLDPLAIPPIADMMPVCVRQKIGPDGPQFHAPSFDLTVHFLDPTPSEWLLLNVHARRARAGYATAETEVWSEDGKLVAIATQTMMLRTGRS